MNSYLRIGSLAAALLWAAPSQATVVHTDEFWRVDFNGTGGTYFVSVYGIGDAVPGGPSTFGFHADYLAPYTGPVISGTASGGLSGGTGTRILFDSTIPGTHLLYMIIFNIVGDVDIQMRDSVWTRISAAEVAAVPLPAALPLFATGLGVLGLLGWRRKRRA